MVASRTVPKSDKQLMDCETLEQRSTVGAVGSAMSLLYQGTCIPEGMGDEGLSCPSTAYLDEGT